MYFKGPFGLMLHCISHRKLFKKGYTWIFHYVIWIVCPFFGHTPETYFAHHMGMHHVENNMIDDASSTLPYQRDSLRGFLAYIGRVSSFWASAILSCISLPVKEKNFTCALLPVKSLSTCFASVCVL